MVTPLGMKGIPRRVIMTSPEGLETEYASQSAAVKALECMGVGLAQSVISEMCRGKRAHKQGWKARWVEDIVRTGTEAGNGNKDVDLTTV